MANRKLKLTEATVELYWLEEAISAEQREQWRKAGYTLSMTDDSWPIPDLGYLQRAISSWGRAVAAGNAAAVKRHMLKRARALGASKEKLQQIQGLSAATTQAEAEASLDEQAERIRNAWRAHCKANPFATYSDETWAREIYADHIVVRLGEDFYSVPFAEDADGITFDTDGATKVEQQWVVAEGLGGFIGPVAEVDGEPDGSTWDVVVIKTGRSKNGRRYREAVLQAAAPLFEGARVLARSDEDHVNQKNKSVLNVVGWIEGVSYTRKAVRGRLQLIDEALRAKLLAAWNRGKRDLVGLSIVAEGTGRQITEGGQKVLDVEAITRVSSVDLVFDPAAGGGLVQLVAAEGKEEEPMLQKLIERLRKAADADIPQVLKGIAESLGVQVPEVVTMITETEGAEDLAERLEKAIKAEPAPAPKTEPTKVKATEAEPPETDEDLVPKALARVVVKTHLAETKLPDPVRKRIERRFGEASFKVDDLTEAIKDEVETWAELEKSNGLGSNGSERQVGVGLEEAEKAIAALDGFFANVDVEIDGAKVPRYRSFREAYIDLTGDSGVSGEVPRRPTGKLGISARNFGSVEVPMFEATDEDGKVQITLSEAGELITTTWAQILGDSVTRQMQREYRLPGLDDWRLLADVVPVKDFRTQRRMVFGGYGDLAAVAEAGAYLDMTTPGDEEATYAASKRGGFDAISIEAIANDDVGAIRRIPGRLARAAKRTLYKFVLSTNFAANPTIYDGVALFHATHGGNLGATALSVASLSAARTVMYEQTDLSTNEQLGVVPRHLWVPIELEQTAYELLRSDRKAGTADNDANYVGSFGIDYHSVLYLTDANNWFLSADKADVPIIEVGFFGSEEPELFTQDSPNLGSLFDNDLIKLKVRHIYGAAVLDFRGTFGAVVA